MEDRMTLCNMVVEAGGKNGAQSAETLKLDNLEIARHLALQSTAAGARLNAGLDAMRCCVLLHPALLPAAAGAQCRVRHCQGCNGDALRTHRAQLAASRSGLCTVNSPALPLTREPTECFHLQVCAQLTRPRSSMCGNAQAPTSRHTTLTTQPPLWRSTGEAVFTSLQRVNLIAEVGRRCSLLHTQ